MLIIKTNDFNIVIKNNNCSINNRVITLTEDDITNLKRIIRNLKDNKPSDEYVYIEEDDKTYYFNNPKPYEYIELKELIGGIYDRQ